MRRGQRRDRAIVFDRRDTGVLSAGNGLYGRRGDLPHHRFELVFAAPLHAVDHFGDLVEVAPLAVPREVLFVDRLWQRIRHRRCRLCRIFVVIGHVDPSRRRPICSPRRPKSPARCPGAQLTCANYVRQQVVLPTVGHRDNPASFAEQPERTTHQHHSANTRPRPSFFGLRAVRLADSEVIRRARSPSATPIETSARWVPFWQTGVKPSAPPRRRECGVSDVRRKCVDAPRRCAA